MKKSLHLPVLLLLAVSSFLGGCSFYDDNKTVSAELIQIDSTTISYVDPVIDSIINIYSQDLEEEMNQIIAVAQRDLTKDRPEGLLNNFVADLVLEKTRQRYYPEDRKEVDFCLLNYGGLRSSIPQGPVSRSRVFELMPFENEIVVVTLSGEKTWELFKYLARVGGGMPVSGITLGISHQQARHVRIQDNLFNKDRQYKVATSDYLAGGGDNMEFFLDPVELEYIGLKVRDAILLHMKEKYEKGEKIDAQLDGRIYLVDK